MPQGPRPSRREVLAGAIGGVAGLVGGAGVASIRRSGESAAGPSDLPYVLGKAAPNLPHGVVRADLRAFKTDSGSDYHQAFADALNAADAVYVPPGEWLTGQTIEVPGGKSLWSDGTFDFEDAPAAGAVIRASAAMPSTVRLTGPGANLSSVNVDGAGQADAAVEFAADSLLLERITAKRGKTYALKATGDFCTIWGGLFQQPTNKGNALYHKGSDLILWGARIKRGAVPLWIDGSGGIIGLLHVTGKSDPASPSGADVRVTGPRNQFVDVFYDSSIGPSLLLEAGANGNRFVGMTIRNTGSDGSFPAIRCDARNGMVSDNRFDAFHTDPGQGSGWSFLIELLGPDKSLAGNSLGSGHADRCKALWNVRPAVVGDVASDGLLSRNGGSTSVSPGQRRLAIAHGLKGAPRIVSVTPSGGGTAPGVSARKDQLVLTWTSSPGGGVVYWTAEL